VTSFTAAEGIFLERRHTMNDMKFKRGGKHHMKRKKKF
jgi:hypothetical protein